MEKSKYFRLHNIERMKSLEGLELASFKRRAVAFIIDVVIAFIIFLAVLAIVGLVVFVIKTEKYNNSC